VGHNFGLVGHSAFGPTNNWPVCSLILRKISTIGVTRCQILRLKCTKLAFHCTTRPRWRSLKRSPDTLVVFKGLLLRGGRRKGCEGKRGSGGKER